MADEQSFPAGSIVLYLFNLLHQSLLTVEFRLLEIFPRVLCDVSVLQLQISNKLKYTCNNIVLFQLNINFHFQIFQVLVFSTFEVHDSSDFELFIYIKHNIWFIDIGKDEYRIRTIWIWGLDQSDIF
jgi:hypothetical protein